MIKYILTSFILVTNLSLYCSEKDKAQDAKKVTEQALNAQKAAQAAQAAAAKTNTPVTGSKVVASHKSSDKQYCDGCRTHHEWQGYYCWSCEEHHGKDWQGQA